MKLEMNLAWSDALRRIGGNRDVVLVVAGVFFFLPYFAFMLISPDPLAGMNAAASSDTKVVMERLSAFYSQLWWVILIIVLVQAAGMLGLIALLSNRSRPTVAQALKLGARKVLSYIAAYLVLGMVLTAALMVVLVLAALSGAVWLTGVVLLAGFVAWIVLFIRFSLVPPILHGARAAVRPVRAAIGALRRGARQQRPECRVGDDFPRLALGGARAVCRAAYRGARRYFRIAAIRLPASPSRAGRAGCSTTRSRSRCA